ncbi:unnamed protein product [Lactuca virosa]|uniref:Cytochrome P450 n=1 Tax=Lactuca virosa TaxID=75947 RepID=A0AAU9NBY6_9ASTR|nr:unnamed protein product [Lactuca virosa]
MEVSAVWCGMGALIILVCYAWRFLNWVWLKPKKNEKCLRDQGLNGSSYKFLFGDLKEVVNMLRDAKSTAINLNNEIVPRVLPFDHKSHTAYGKICFTWMGPTPKVQITDPSMVREVLANNYQFQKPRGGNPLIRTLGAGLTDADGDRWSKHRKIVNPAFHVEKLKHMVPAIYVSCAEMINKWEERLKKESSCEVDVWPYLQTLSSDVISRTAFGSNIDEGKRIFELQRELAVLVIDAIQSLYIPGSSFFPTKNNNRIKKIDQEVKATIRSIIDKRIIAMKAGKRSKDDLLGILLESNYREIKHGNKNSGLTIDEVIDEC